MTTFDQIWTQVSDGSTLGKYKSKNLYDLLISTFNVKGIMAEIGVYKGNTAKLMRITMPTRELHLYDTFKGIVNSDQSIDVHPNGEFQDTNLDSVKRYVGTNHVIYHEGIFPDTFDKNSTTQYSFVHSDTDTYFGTINTLKLILPKLSIGGKLLFDDYNWEKCPGVRKAIAEYIGSNRIPVKCQPLLYQYVITRLR